MFNSKLTLSFLSLLLFTCSAISQNFGGCNVGSDASLEFRTTDCDNSSDAWLNKYRGLDFWVPDQDVPTKTVMVNFVVCRDNNGQNGWQDTPQFRDQVDEMFQRVNEIYSDVQQPGYNVSCPVSFEPIEDTRIRFELNEIYFIDNTTFNNASYGASIIDWLHSNYPESKYCS